MHRNEVTLVGRLSRAPRGKELPSGDLMTMWGLAVRRPPGHASGKKADGIACVTFDPEISARVAEWRVDDVVSVEGTLHQRYRGGSSGGTSTYEVEVHRAARLESRRPSRLESRRFQGGDKPAGQPEEAAGPLERGPERSDIASDQLATAPDLLVPDLCVPAQLVSGQLVPGRLVPDQLAPGSPGPERLERQGSVAGGSAGREGAEDQAGAGLGAE
ncbi:single-stranded DNA-binding protein [Sphaerisporangium viridialbum]|uniref:single-stranded DNA-binding protein n=1 Tax=Sphaerisporangium viridialbum TaxID=46189 RepID=UPI003C729354